MTNPTTTERFIDVNATIGNIFGSLDDADTIEALCEVSDWAFNTRLDLIMANSWLKVEHFTFDDVCNDLARHVGLPAEMLEQLISWEKA